MPKTIIKICSSDYKDAMGRTGYRLVSLPWGDVNVENNFPDGFVDDILPDSGWDLVMNKCGNHGLQKGSYFALYNKYTGTLRFFFYLSSGFKAGSDHLWQIEMTNALANRSPFGYGLPSEEQYKDLSMIDQTNARTMLQYITPWVDNGSIQNGYIVPRQGWWTFDVDLSLYRPNEPLGDDDAITPKMRTWTEHSMSLYSTTLATINGTMQGEFDSKTKGAITSANSSQGFLNYVSPYTKVLEPLKKVIELYSKSDYLGIALAGFELAKTGVNVVTGKSVSGNKVDLTTEGKFGGTVNMIMDGVINSTGLSIDQCITDGVPSPRLKINSEFDTQNTTLGQGVWNIKHHPIVYRTQILIPNGEGVPILRDYAGYKLTSEIFWTFFDPSSVEVELNPEVFPEDQIEWMEVSSFCGTRPFTDWDKTSNQRAALGLTGNERNRPQYITKDIKKENTINYLDFFKWSDNKMGLTYPTATTWNKFTLDPMFTDAASRAAFGSGDDVFIMEPQMVLSTTDLAKYRKYYSPPMEISVNVVVKLKDYATPFILSRIYLPEYKDINLDSNYMDAIYERAASKACLPAKTEGHTAFYDYQTKRLYNIFKTIKGQ